MELKKLHMGTVAFGWDAMDEVAMLLAQSLGDHESGMSKYDSSARCKMTILNRPKEIVDYSYNRPEQARYVDSGA